MRNNKRREVLSTLLMTTAAVPVAFLPAHAFAAQNQALRTALKYQDTPKDGNHCNMCLHWKPGADATALGGCAIIPGDTEIHPDGWCSAYVKKG